MIRKSGLIKLVLILWFLNKYSWKIVCNMHQPFGLHLSGSPKCACLFMLRYSLQLIKVMQASDMVAVEIIGNFFFQRFEQFTSPTTSRCASFYTTVKRVNQIMDLWLGENYLLFIDISLHPWKAVNWNIDTV